MKTRVEGVSGYYVYVLFREDGVTPFYVGLSRRASRISEHVDSSAKRRKWKDRIVAKVVAALGYVPYVVAANGLSKDAAVLCEKGLIAFYGRKPSGPLVNATNGGDGVVGYVASAEMRAKLSAAAKLRGFSEEHRRNISRAKTGHTQSEETRKKISETRRARGISEKQKAAYAAGRGRKATEEHRQAIAKALSGKKKTAKHVEAVLAALAASPKWAAYNARRNSRKGCAPPPVEA